MRENARQQNWMMSIVAVLAILAVSLLFLTGAMAPPAPNDYQAQIDDLNEELAEKADRWEIVELRGLISSLDREIQAANGLVEQHRDILEQISRTSDGTTYVPSIEANMQRDGFGDEMRRVVNASIDGESSITITNKTGTTHTITVNATRYSLAPGESRSIDVPTGNVSTRLAGQDVVNWSVGPPRYNQRLQILNRPGAITYLCPWPY